MSLIKILFENYSLVEKEYLRSEKITDQKAIDILLDITNKDGYTKFLFDIYYISLGKQLQQEYTFLKKYMEEWYERIKNYNTKIIPLQILTNKKLDDVIEDYMTPDNIKYQLERREKILKLIKKLP